MSASESQDSDGYAYLSDLSERDKPWDTHKAETERLQRLYRGSVYDSLAGRLRDCSGLLEFGWIADSDTGEIRLKLKAARFCRVRHCPICQWRRSLMWVARFLKALPAITADYPAARWLFLTLTVRNCPLEDLRETLTHMNASWKRLSHRKDFPAIGFARSTEVTRGKDGTAHPHFHVLMMVNPSYFTGKNYISQERWIELWQSCLQVDYAPTVRVQAVKVNSRRSGRVNGAGVGSDPVAAAIVETFKYSVKPNDLLGTEGEIDKQWLLELTKQLHKTRAVALGGVIRNYLSENDPEDLIGEEEGEDDLADISLLFGWREMIQRYVKV